MAEYSLYGKKRLCYTDILDYTDFQGIGKDPLYKRFDSVKSVIRQYIPAEFQHFFAQPIYSQADDIINWYIEEWNEEPKRLVELNETDRNHYQHIKEVTLQIYKKSLQSLSGEERSLLAGALKYIHDDAIFCYDEKVVLVAWGMRPDTKRHVITGAVIHDFVLKKKYKIHFDAGEHGRLRNPLDQSLQREEGFELTKEDLPAVAVEEGYRFQEWVPSPYGYKVTGPVSFKATYEQIPVKPSAPQEPQPVEEKKPEKPERVTVKFRSGNDGKLVGETILHIKEGTCLQENQLPKVIPNAKRNFTGWFPTITGPITKDSVFTAQYEEQLFECRFQPGEFGELQGTTLLFKREGDSILSNELPAINPARGYKFTSWDEDPLTCIIERDVTFTALYEKKIPWYERLWAWLTSDTVRKWLKRLVLLLLFVLILMLLLRACESCSRDGRNAANESNGPLPIEQITAPDGSVIDDNNHRAEVGIVGADGSLPDDPSLVVAPIRGDDGTVPPIHREPGRPDIIANRLNLYFEDENVDLQAFADAFKELYPDNDYQIIGCDDHVKMMQIQIPEAERNSIREKLPVQLDEFKFFVVDESLFVGYGHKNQASSLSGWHLKAVHAREAWNITRGNKEVVVAVVDDGVDYTHPMFANRITKAYNVFTQDNRLSMGEGHGTHVAGLAVGSTDYLDQGVAGIAPDCLLMPVQVFDNEFCTFSSVTSGIMYAMHEGADVINISIGMSFEGLNQLPIDQQRALSDILCTNEEKVWKKIIGIANKKNCILVFAVGNDQILATVPPENRIGSSVNVAAVGPDLRAAQFSNFGEGATISAPGVAIASAYPKQAFQIFDGTSMAAPIVTGTVALLRSIDDDITVREVISVLQGTGRNTDRILPPMVQVDRALLAVKSGNYTDFSPISEDTERKDSDNSTQSGSDKVTDPSQADRSNEVITPGNNAESEEKISKGAESEVDYSKIRVLIDEYKRRIEELEKLLPENKK